MSSRGFDTMDGFLIRLLVPIYILISLSLVISHARAVEPPRKARELRDKSNHINLKVNPTAIEFYPNDVITISCRAKSGNKATQFPLITFHRELEPIYNLNHKLTSGDPGVLIQEVPTDYLKGENRVKKILTLGPKAWETMEFGENRFYCKAIDLDHVARTVEYFIIDKRPHRNGRKVRRHRRAKYPHVRRNEISPMIS